MGPEPKLSDKMRDCLKAQAAQMNSLTRLIRKLLWVNAIFAILLVVFMLSGLASNQAISTPAVALSMSLTVLVALRVVEFFIPK
jgi:hypothetical protein